MALMGRVALASIADTGTVAHPVIERHGIVVRSSRVAEPSSNRSRI